MSQVQIEGRHLDVVDDAWKKEKLPHEDVAVPLAELPDPEADNGNTESIKEQENKWNDLGLAQFSGTTNQNERQ